MKTTDIAFVKLTGIKQEEDNLSLEFNDNIQNHINTIHAGAQFTLAETQWIILTKIISRTQWKSDANS
jgi:acyl-coenzyme A thioesterase PaaI-like protein